MTWLAVVVGAAAGAPLRFLVDRWLTERTARPGGAGAFPWGLLAVNASGSALAGAVIALATGDLRVLLLVGLCGAYTTFSGYAWETVRLWPEARVAFWASVALLPTACVSAFMLAWRIAGLAAS
jgi:CrcB protein